MFTTLINENKEYLAYIENETEDDFQEIKTDFQDTIKSIEKLKGKVKTEKDIYKLDDDDDIDFLYECIATYESIFIMDHRDSEKLKENEKEYEKIQDLLDIFNFDEDDEEDDDDN